MADLNEQLEEFKLPRTDWYDNEGRIYKDRLIENFNAIEQRLIQLSELDNPIISLPDISQVHFPNVTLSDDDNKIVNLGSLIDIMNLKGYPVELKFNGSNLCASLIFYDKGCNFVSLEKEEGKEGREIKTLSGDKLSNTNKYIYINYAESTPQDEIIFCSSSYSTPTDCKLVAVYEDGKIYGINTKSFININILQPLANMKSEMYDYKFNSGTNEKYPSGGKGITRNGRTLGCGGTNTDSSGDNNVTLRDVGRKVV